MFENFWEIAFPAKSPPEFPLKAAPAIAHCRVLRVASPAHPREVVVVCGKGWSGAMLKSEELTTFQWLAPSMVRDGLLKNGDWVLQAAEEAQKLFSDEHLKSTAQFRLLAEQSGLSGRAAA